MLGRDSYRDGEVVRSWKPSRLASVAFDTQHLKVLNYCRAT